MTKGPISMSTNRRVKTTEDLIDWNTTKKISEILFNTLDDWKDETLDHVKNILSAKWQETIYSNIQTFSWIIEMQQEMLPSAIEIRNKIIDKDSTFKLVQFSRIFLIACVDTHQFSSFFSSIKSVDILNETSFINWIGDVVVVKISRRIPSKEKWMILFNLNFFYPVW